MNWKNDFIPLIVQIHPLPGASNHLRHFLNILQWMDLGKRVEFSYACHGEDTLSNLTLKQNILLESVPRSIFKGKEQESEEYLNSISNLPLKLMIDSLGNLERFSKELSREEKKMASLVKALLRPVDYIMLEVPEKNLISNQLDLLKEAIIFEAYQKRKKIFITTSSEEWTNILTHEVHLSEESEIEFYQLDGETRTLKLLA